MKLIVILLIGLFMPFFLISQDFNCTYQSSGPNPETPTPVIAVNLTSSASASQNIPITIPSNGYGQCCVYADNYNCLTLEVTVNPNSGGILFNVAGANGNTYIRLNDCNSTVYDAGHTFCPSGPGPYYFSFCRTGSTDYNITVTSVASPSGPSDIITADGCSKQLIVYGLEPSSVTWSSILQNGHSSNYYNNYLSNINGGQIGVSGGTAPYTYVWSNGATTQDITGILIGNYSVNVHDANGNSGGCYATTNTTITQPLNISSNTQVISNYNGENISCYGASDGSVSVIVTGGVPNYFYNWINKDGIIVSTNQIASDLPAGIYTIQVIDENNCLASNSITLKDPTKINVNLHVSTNYNGQQISCYGASDGGINLSVAGGIPGYRYKWTDINGNIISTLEDPSSLPKGKYNVLITDVNGCNIDTSIIIQEPQQLIGITSVISNYNGQNVSCYNSIDGIIKATANGGTPAYTYLWMDISGITISTNETVYGIGAGKYIVQIKDLNGCLFNTEIIVSQPNILISEANVISNFFNNGVSCIGAKDGIIEAHANGGTPRYRYSWNTTPIQNEIQISKLGIGIYTVTITDINGCTSSKDVELTANQLPMIDLPPPTYSCKGNSVLLDCKSNLSEQCIWTFSDGKILKNCEPFFTTFENEGCYDLELKIISAQRCTTSVSASNFICIFPNPIADFTADDYELSNLKNTTHFWNNSISSNTFRWDFGDGSEYDSIPNSMHEYLNTNEFNKTIYQVTLYAYSEHGCKDSITKPITYSPQLIYYVPNSFTPDFDEFNNIFKPVFSSGYDNKKYTFTIFNRWGEIIYETHQIEEGWNGYYKENKSPDGTYTWKLSITDSMNSQKHENVGHVNVIR